MKKMEYNVVGLSAFVANILITLGSILIVFNIKSLLGSSMTGKASGGIQFSFIVFLFGLAAVFVVAVYQFIYFVLQEKKNAVLLGAIASAAVFLIYVFSITSILVSFTASLFTGGMGMPGMLIFCILVSIVSAVFNGLVYFQLNEKLQIAFLVPMMPEKIKTVTIVEHPLKEETKEEGTNNEEQ